jgi:hypothetical protein
VEGLAREDDVDGPPACRQTIRREWQSPNSSPTGPRRRVEPALRAVRAPTPSGVRKSKARASDLVLPVRPH